MIVVGSHSEEWIPALRAAALMLDDRASRQIGDLYTDFQEEGLYRLHLLDGHQLSVSISDKRIEIILFGDPNTILVKVTDESIALDADDLQSVTIDSQWLTKLTDRLVEIAADYQNVDPSGGRPPLPPEAWEKAVAVYRYVAAHMQRSGHDQEMDIHLTMPTDYWSANVFCSDAAGKRYLIANDPAFDEMLAELPSCAEIIGREGEGAAIEIAPLYLTPVRINSAVA